MSQTIEDFMTAHPIDPEMYWRDPAQNQLHHFAVTLPEALVLAPPTVVSTHRSKSITLPVVAFEDPERGIRVALRDNFHDRKLSVVSDGPVSFDPSSPGIHDDARTLSPCYFEGFPSPLVFGPYASNPRRFSFEFTGPYVPHGRWTGPTLVQILGTIFGRGKVVEAYLSTLA